MVSHNTITFILSFRYESRPQPQKVRVESIKMTSVPAPQRHPSVGNVSATSTLTREERKSIVAIRKINPGEKAEITLTKKDRGFGFSIRGGEGISLYVLRVAEGGAAHEDGRLKVCVLFIKVKMCTCCFHGLFPELTEIWESRQRILVVYEENEAVVCELSDYNAVLSMDTFGKG